MHIPVSTYRLQLHKDFPFSKAQALIPYLKKLGISDLYSSPILQAEPRSTHGYNGTDFKHISNDLGSEESLTRLAENLRKNGMGLCVDIVPNHMAATAFNKYWQDVLDHGQHSQYAYLFDINWDRSTKEQLSYRRFFDINELVCLRAEEEQVFLVTHKLILSLIEKNLIQGLRIDHVDGLRKPQAYLKELQKHIHKPFYIVVEKILGHAEKLPTSWPIAGTTGYDFLNEVNQFFIHHEGLKCINREYIELCDSAFDIDAVKQNSLKKVMQCLFAKEHHALVRSLAKLLNAEESDVSDFFTEFSSLMAVYRIYGENESNKQDRLAIETIFKHMKSHSSAALQFKKLLLLEKLSDFDSEKLKNWERWRNNWEVFSGPVMAKGFEDTTCYNYYPLISINEVGSSSYNFQHSGDKERLHNYNIYKQQNWPYAMNASSTHDTKRSEDLRARINVLSEKSAQWNAFLKKWILRNQSKKSDSQPDNVDEILIYQTLLGAWPLNNVIDEDFRNRIKNYLMKAVRERKEHTTWAEPNEGYEQATYKFVNSLFDDNQFRTEFQSFQQEVSFYGMYNSLTQLVLKATCPGIPDFYQGTETWRFDLVDPDNRKPVDYEMQKNLFSSEPLSFLLKHWQDGAIKLNLTQQLLKLRNQYADLFLHGNYEPINIHGPHQDNLFAFSRNFKGDSILVVCCRWFTDLVVINSDWSADWFSADTLEVSGNYKSLLENYTLEAEDTSALKVNAILKTLPFAILKKY